jgi:hypothetical protein
MLLLKEALFLLLTFLDIEFTKDRISEYGVAVELNPLIRKLISWFGSGKWGVEAGVDLGVLLPTGGLMALGWYHPEILAFMIGVRFTLFLFQQTSRFNGNDTKSSDAPRGDLHAGWYGL